MELRQPQPVVRQALKMLAVLAMLDLKPGLPATVRSSEHWDGLNPDLGRWRQSTRSDVDGLYEQLTRLETRAGVSADLWPSPEQLVKLRAWIEHMGNAPAEPVVRATVSDTQQWRPSAKRARTTLADVARAAGVSTATVSRSFHRPEALAPRMLERVTKASQLLGYVPDRLAGALVSRRTNLVAVTCALGHDRSQDVLKATKEQFEGAGLQLVVRDTDASSGAIETTVEALLGYAPEAMILIGLEQTPRSRRLLSDAGIPVVEAIMLPPAPIDLNVGFDHRQAAAAAVRHLHGKGHRKIAHLSAEQEPFAASCLEGFTQAMGSLGLGTDGLVGTTGNGFTSGGGAELLARLLTRSPEVTAVLAGNEHLALGALIECQRRGIRAPGQVEIVSFVDCDWCELAAISAVSADFSRMGSWAAAAILEIIRGSGRRPDERIHDVGFTIPVRGAVPVS